MNLQLLTIKHNLNNGKKRKSIHEIDIKTIFVFSLQSIENIEKQ